MERSKKSEKAVEKKVQSREDTKGLQDVTGVGTVTVSDETLDATPQRLVKFLRAVGTRPAIQMALGAVGYTNEEHQRGWALLHASSGYAPRSEFVPVVDADVTAAIASLDAEDERVHVRIDATLKHRFPAVRAALLQGIAPGQGASSVVYFRALLDRLDALEKSPPPEVTKADAAEALRVLVQRGLSPARRAELRAMVKAAETFVGAAAKPEAPSEEAIRGQLLAARAWFEEWSEIARAELKRKDYLILLGLAQRKSPKKAKAQGGTGEPVA